MITTTAGLAEACREIARHPFVTVDTEFLRENTFWPELCVLQMACSGHAWIVDTLAPGLQLDPFFALMTDQNVVKVFHAARQDLEIIWHLGGLIPQPVFDTQVAAMVCGYGDSISYDQLVGRITGHQVDKSSRFTDWKRRPLTERQLDYALSDVTHLRDVYLAIKANLEEQGREHWVREEMEVLTSPDTYHIAPEDAWQRLKLRVRRPRELALLREIAAWRERTARAGNVPRGRVLKDDAIYELCAQMPADTEALSALRALPRGFERSRFSAEILALVADVAARPREALPAMPPSRPSLEGSAAAVELLKVLLKHIVEKHGVAAKVIATVDDLERIAGDDEADVAALKGWRRELFGQAALDLKQGRLALGFDGRSVIALPVPDDWLPELGRPAGRPRARRGEQARGARPSGPRDTDRPAAAS